MAEKSEQREERSPENKLEQLQKWEYKTLVYRRGFKNSCGEIFATLSDKNRGLLEPSKWLSDEKFSLDELGDEGWELINALSISDYGGAEGAGFTTQVLYLFKRPKEFVPRVGRPVSRLSEQPSVPEVRPETKKFSPESREALENKGYVIYELQGKSLDDLQKETGEPFVEQTQLQEWVGGEEGWTHRATLGPFWNKTPDTALEVAIIPIGFFLPESNDKGIRLQREMLEKFSQEVGKEIGGVKAVMGEASEYAELILQHRAKTGKTLIPKPPDLHVIATRTPLSDGNDLVEIAEFDGRLRCFDYPEFLQNGGKGQTWIAPLVVPV